MIYITGDMHGDISRFDSPAIKQLKKGDTLIVCGDFGFVWDNSKIEQKILKKLGKKKFNVCFIDGTHENFELLNAYPLTNWNGGKVHHICGNVYHLMRGQIFKIDNMTFFTMGGGESPDIDIRFENNTIDRFEDSFYALQISDVYGFDCMTTLQNGDFAKNIRFLLNALVFSFYLPFLFLDEIHLYQQLFLKSLRSHLN